jgi:hypothetical protein
MVLDRAMVVGAQLAVEIGPEQFDRLSTPGHP